MLYRMERFEQANTEIQPLEGLVKPTFLNKASMQTDLKQEKVALYQGHHFYTLY